MSNLSDKQPPELESHIKCTWCPGCGSFGIWQALKQALTSLSIPEENLVLVYDVGCCGNMADFNKSYGFHALHGRTLPPAAGIKLANHELTVIAIIGDGGCYGEGLTHFINLMRGNHDITVLVHNNERYSLTTGQMSPTTKKGTKTKSTPEGSIEEPLNPIALGLSADATFVARGFAGDPRLNELILKGIQHRGFALLDILQPCISFNREQNHQWYQQNIIKLEDEQHDPTDKQKAWAQAMRKNKLATGLFYQVDKPTYHQQVSEIKDQPLVKKGISQTDITRLLDKFK